MKHTLLHTDEQIGKPVLLTDLQELLKAAPTTRDYSIEELRKSCTRSRGQWLCLVDVGDLTERFLIEKFLDDHNCIVRFDNYPGGFKVTVAVVPSWH